MKRYTVRVSFVARVEAATRAEAKRRAVKVQRRPLAARVLSEHDYARHVCTFCGVRARGLRRVRDAADAVHWAHGRCLKEVSRG